MGTRNIRFCGEISKHYVDTHSYMELCGIISFVAIFALTI